MKYKVLTAAILLFGISAFFFFTHDSEQTPVLSSKAPRKLSIEPGPVMNLEKEEDANENPEERLEYELYQLVDPATGQLPSGIREKELTFAQQTLKPDINAQPSTAPGFDFASAAAGTTEASPFRSVGPFNVGGRTRAVAIDVSNENTLLAGGVAGGVWKTTDQGATWTRTTALQQHPAITDIVQDKRSGKNSEWYYSTGEFRGNSASATGAFYQGNGLYKSTDNGDSWSLLGATAVPGTSGTDVITSSDDFTLIDDLAIDLSESSGTEIYAAGKSQIIRSTDGFATFDIVLGDANTGNNQCAVAINSAGKVFATIANSNFNGSNSEEGVFMSDDGQTWTNIDPPGLDNTFPRMTIGIDPSDENMIYFVSDDQLFLFNDLTDSWTDLSNNLGFSSDVGEGFNSQGGYDLLVSVHPDNGSIVYVGGTNLLRSTTGFGTGAATRQIGGYREDGNANSFPTYNNHHPDQHVTVFFDSDADLMLTGTDGGVHLTRDNRANSTTTTTPVVWESLNNGYLTSQFYHGDIHNYDFGDDQVIGGLQDNGTWASFDGNDQGAWASVFGGDGAFSGINYNSLFVSSQNGNLFRYELVGSTYQQAGNISPTNNDADFLFINPFIYNPVHQDQLIVGARGRIFITNDIRENPGNGQWLALSGPGGLVNQFVSALAMSTQPEGVLYFGTRTGGLFKIQNTQAADEDTQIIELERGNMPNGNVSGIAVDPLNADRVFVTFSNYNIVSIWMSEDGGSTWSSVSGNLEENPDGGGAGPSIRAVEVMPDGNGGHFYFVGTSVGLYMTQQLNGDQTVWTQQGASTIGNIVVGNVKVRAIDGVVMVSTHANGVFKGGYDVGVTPNINYSFQSNDTEVLIRGNVSLDSNNPLGYRWFKDGEVFAENTDEITVTDGGDYQLQLFTSDADAMSNIIKVGLDGAGPEISSITRLNPTDQTTSETSVQFQVTFNEIVLNVSSDDFATSGQASGTIGTVTESSPGTVFDVTVENIGGSGQLGLGVAAGNNIMDEAGNEFSGTITSAETYTIEDNTAPTAAITRANPSTEVTNQNEVTLVATFTEAVQNVDVTDFELATGSAPATITAVTELTSITYAVVVSDILEDGTIDIDFVQGQDIQDNAGNAFDGTVTSEETYTIENVITSIDDPLLRNVQRILVDANPSSGLFNLAFPNAFIGDFEMQVTDIQGRRLTVRQVENYASGEQVELDLTTAPDGLYIVKASNGERSASIKLLKVSSSR